MTDKKAPVIINDRERLTRESNYSQDPSKLELLKRNEKLTKENPKNR
jgi:hypothetical protein